MILTGYELAKSIKDNLKLKIKDVIKDKKCNFVLLTNLNNDLLSYRKIIRKNCEELNINYIEQPIMNNTEAAIIQIQNLNNDDNIHAISLEFPIPSYLNKNLIYETLSIEKDVDCINPYNLGLLMLGCPQVIPCAANATLQLLLSLNIELKKKNVVIVGSSNLVGNPIAQLLIRKKCTVTLTNSDTCKNNLELLVKNADILISAVGIPNLIPANWISKNCIVIDIGTSPVDNTVKGDVETENLNCYAITPPIGGIGPITIAILMSNIINCYLHI